MSLLLLDNHEEACRVADKICAAEIPNGKVPKDGLIQTIILLEIAVHYRDTDFFRWCGRWTYILMSRRMPGVPEKAARAFVENFCEMLQRQLWWLHTQEERALAFSMLGDAIEEIKTADRDTMEDFLSGGSNEAIRKEYLSRLLAHDLTGAVKLITAAVDARGLTDVYTDIIQNVMYEVGELWHQNKISIAQEHYCTAATQSILSMFYPRVLEKPKNGKKAVVACIGSELHELGARMVSDLLEEAGWDCVFLGAAVPLDALLEILKKEQPQLCVLSVALQQGVPECAEMIGAVKRDFPDIAVAVGGHAFVKLKKAGPQLGADIYAQSARELLERAKSL